MTRLHIKLTFIVITVICSTNAQLNAGGGRAGSVGASSSGSSDGSGLSGDSGPVGSTVTETVLSTHKNSACWMRAEDFLSNFNGPQGWEFNQPVYAEKSDCSQTLDQNCIGVNKFYPETSTKNSNTWKNKKVLYYPFGLVNWAQLSPSQTDVRPLIVGENGNGHKMMLCRHFSEVQQYTIGTHTEGEPKCRMKSGETDEQLTNSVFETLVITPSGESAGMNPNVRSCSQPTNAQICNGGPGISDALCWQSYSKQRFNFLVGEPLGKDDTDLAYLVRVFWSENKNGKVAFGKLLFPQQKIHIIGLDAPPNGGLAVVDVLRFSHGIIHWEETNSTAIRRGFPEYALVLGELPGNPYELGRKRNYHTICQPEIGQDRSKKVLLGMVDSETGYCEAIFKGQVAHFPKFWIPMQHQKKREMITGRCPGSELTGEPYKQNIIDEINSYVAQYPDLDHQVRKHLQNVYAGGPSETIDLGDGSCGGSDHGDVIDFDGYTLTHNNRFQRINFVCLNEFESCKTSATVMT